MLLSIELTRVAPIKFGGVSWEVQPVTTIARKASTRAIDTRRGNDQYDEGS